MNPVHKIGGYIPILTIGSYKIRLKNHKDKELTLHVVTMIDPVTGLFEMKQIPNKEAHTVAEAVEQTWFSRYP